MNLYMEFQTILLKIHLNLSQNKHFYISRNVHNSSLFLHLIGKEQFVDKNI